MGREGLAAFAGDRSAQYLDCSGDNAVVDICQNSLMRNPITRRETLLSLALFVAGLANPVIFDSYPEKIKRNSKSQKQTNNNKKIDQSNKQKTV